MKRALQRVYERTRVKLRELVGTKVFKKWEAEVQVDDPAYDLGSEDKPLIVVVMGATGVGKSTYINGLLGSRRSGMTVGHTMESCTKTLCWESLTISETPLADHEDFLQLSHRRVVLVDTPALDDNTIGNNEVLRRIAVWLAKSFTEGHRVAALVYLHNLSSNRIGGTSKEQIDAVQNLIGKNALRRVLIGFTHWEYLAPKRCTSTRTAVEAVYFKEMLDRGARVEQVSDSTPGKGVEASDVSMGLDPKATRAKHWEQLSPILLEALYEPSPILNIQDELVRLNRKTVRTTADRSMSHGRALTPSHTYRMVEDGSCSQRSGRTRQAQQGGNVYNLGRPHIGGPLLDPKPSLQDGGRGFDATIIEGVIVFKDLIASVVT